jgi:hypothetical protein
MKRVLSVILSFAALLPATAPASAEVQAIGKFKDWRVFKEVVGRETICYAAVEADDITPKNFQHGEVTFYVASWKSGSAANQPSMKVGYDLRTDIAPVAVVNGQRFKMYASGNEAFVPDASEKGLLAALKKGTELRIEAARKETRTAYSFSLKGSTEAMDKARALCK